MKLLISFFARQIIFILLLSAELHAMDSVATTASTSNKEALIRILSLDGTILTKVSQASIERCSTLMGQLFAPAASTAAAASSYAENEQAITLFKEIESVPPFEQEHPFIFFHRFLTYKTLPELKEELLQLTDDVLIKVVTIADFLGEENVFDNATTILSERFLLPSRIDSCIKEGSYAYANETSAQKALRPTLSFQSVQDGYYGFSVPIHTEINARIVSNMLKNHPALIYWLMAERIVNNPCWFSGNCPPMRTIELSLMERIQGRTIGDIHYADDDSCILSVHRQAVQMPVNQTTKRKTILPSEGEGFKNYKKIVVQKEANRALAFTEDKQLVFISLEEPKILSLHTINFEPCSLALSRDGSTGALLVKKGLLSFAIHVFHTEPLVVFKEIAIENGCIHNDEIFFDALATKLLFMNDRKPSAWVSEFKIILHDLTGTNNSEKSVNSCEKFTVSRSGRIMACLSRKKLQMWSLADGTLKEYWIEYKGDASKIVFNQDDSILALLTKYESVRMSCYPEPTSDINFYHVATGKYLGKFQFECTDIEFNRTGDYLAIIPFSGGANHFNLAHIIDNELRKTLLAGGLNFIQAALLIYAYNDGNVRKMEPAVKENRLLSHHVQLLDDGIRNAFHKK